MMDLSAVVLRQPLWLLLALVPFAALLLAWLRQGLRGDGYAERQLLPWALMGSRRSRGEILRRVLLVLAWAGFALAMAGPREALRSWQADHARDVPVVVLVDVSRSMAVMDGGLSRIARARIELLDLLKQVKHVRMGITVFGARAHLLAPLTHDRVLLRHYVGLLRTDLLPTAGSDIDMALASAQGQLADAGMPGAILLISDGDYQLDAEARARLETRLGALRRAGIRLYVLGVGSEQARAIPDAAKGWLHYRGKAVTTRRDRRLLRRLAEVGGGRYSDAQNGNGDWARLYGEGIAGLLRRDGGHVAGGREYVLWRELYHWPLLFAAGLFLLAHLRRPRAGGQVVVLLLLTPLLFSPPPASADDAAEAYALGMQAWARGDFADAQARFARLPGYRARMGEGAARYRQGQYRGAATAFIQAVLQATDDDQRSRALFNLANSYFRLEDYAQAASLYEDVLRYRPAWQAAKNNLEFARALQARVEAATIPRAGGRAGRGPGSARLPPGSDPGEGGVGLDEAATAMPILPPLPASPRESTDAADAAAVGGAERYRDEAWTYTIDDMAFLPQQLERLSGDEAVIWQRLFEAEEGFHAPLETPRAVPGVRPW